MLEHDWENKCKLYLPVTSDGSPWRFSRPTLPEDPEQGWKLHVSASILTAPMILGKIAPFLSSTGILFKAPISLQEVKKINCGLFYGFSQVGKIITVYPPNAQAAISIAQALHRLTYRIRSPAVPYDVTFRKQGCVYYRYGSFKTLEMVNDVGTRVPAMHDPSGNLIADLRGPGLAIPSWAIDPFRKHGRRKTLGSSPSPLKTTFRAYEALFQRGKGGVYRALDLSRAPARLCVLKEGRRDGETDVDGRDGYWRVKHEGEVLPALREAGVEVPEVYASFKVEPHYYLALEYIKGSDLQTILRQKKQLSPAEAIHYGIQIARFLDKIHRAGWVWRDCKPLNLIVTKRNVLRPIDFEGACRVDSPDPMPWGTTGYVPPEWVEVPKEGSRRAEDLYALGATMYQLLTGRTLGAQFPLPPIGRVRQHISPGIRKIIHALLDADPCSRPDARTVFDIFVSERRNAE